MIISDLRSWEQEPGWLPPFRQALAWLEQEVTEDTPAGKYEIDGERLFVLVQHVETRPAEEQLAESHKQYIDIQLLLKGRELIRVARDNGEAVVTADELDSRDRLSYKDVSDESDIVLTPGMFAVFFPYDIHRPCCSVEAEMTIRKAVVKLHVSLFENSAVS
ncbi:hypothetical protein BBD42_06355 [Paenibacillus sp. BIHB 4019]|uniref:YhcH/YjgK/YiaL family protein n=1 Tax=Paenibacillus sp. BIHB 4019 TaxID=1870819 RepID=A0A1B2DEH9_9BACL|nr:YhcH/YjgK/YiaL family protein [Paenibacillus sp. BIHB 4019]ANY66121.1 hypothetical protein BBD42_06355 [Paenibacillus sp. BIHB 4019]